MVFTYFEWRFKTWYLYIGKIFVFTEWFEFQCTFHQTLQQIKSNFFRNFIFQEEACVHDVAFNATFAEQFFIAFIVTNQWICTEWICVRFDNECIWIDMSIQFFRCRTTSCQRCTHSRCQYWIINFKNRWQSFIFHKPYYGINRFTNVVYAIICPELRFDSTTIAITHIFGQYNLATIFIHCYAYVL